MVRAHLELVPVAVAGVRVRWGWEGLKWYFRAGSGGTCLWRDRRILSSSPV
jgi:hypothetical protein